MTKDERLVIRLFLQAWARAKQRDRDCVGWYRENVLCKLIKRQQKLIKTDNAALWLVEDFEILDAIIQALHVDLRRTLYVYYDLIEACARKKEAEKLVYLSIKRDCYYKRLRSAEDHL